MRGTIGTNNAGSGYLWLGNGLVSGGGNGYPDSTTPAAHYRIQQPMIVSGLSCSLNIPPGATGSGASLVTKIRYTPLNTSTPLDTSFNVIFGERDYFKEYFSSSLSLNVGDKLHLYVDASDNSTATDLTAQVDMF